MQCLRLGKINTAVGNADYDQRKGGFVKREGCNGGDIKCERANAEKGGKKEERRIFPGKD